MITDRMNIELTDNAGNSWNITSSSMDGYYDGSLGGVRCAIMGLSDTDTTTIQTTTHGGRLANTAKLDWVANDNSPSTSTKPLLGSTSIMVMG